MLEWITEHQDGINLFLIKLTGTALTVLTTFGYLDAVSNWSWLLNIHIIVFAIILLMINLLGYSVYLIKMKRDSASDATLLNHLYTGTALGTPSKNKNFLFRDIDPIAFYPYTH